MLLNTILNHVQKFKSFVFKKAQWANSKKTEIETLWKPGLTADRSAASAERRDRAMEDSLLGASPIFRSGASP